MKSPILPFLAFAAVASHLAAQDNVYSGTFTASVGYAYQRFDSGLDSPIPGIAVGTAYTGWYSYESPTLDTPTDSAPINEQASFYQSIQGDIVFPGVADFQMGYNDTMDLQVQNGQLTMFYAGPDDGPASGNFVMAGSWGFESSSWNAGISGDIFGDGAVGSALGGLLTFTNPVLEDPEIFEPNAGPSVPDSAPTAILMGLALAFFILTKGMRKTVRA